MANPRVISVVGWHNSGKTTFIERLVAALKARGLKLAVIKHSGGQFDLDQPGTDTWRFSQSGSDVVAIAGHDRLAILERCAAEPSLADLLARLPEDIDLVITEGFKRESTPKFEVIRHEIGGKRIAGDDTLLALVIDDRALIPVDEQVCWLWWEDIAAAVALLERRQLI